MSEEGDGVWVVYRIALGHRGDSIRMALAWVKSEPDARRLVETVRAETEASLGSAASTQKLLHAIGVRGFGFDYEFVPRHSEIEIARPNSPLIVGKA